MRLTLPITGTVKREGSVHGDGLLEGAPDDPIRLIGISLGNVSWKMVDVDLEKEEMAIEVTPSDMISIPTGEIDENGEDKFIERKATLEEKADALEFVRMIAEEYTKEELFAVTGDERLRRPLRQILQK